MCSPDFRRHHVLVREFPIARPASLVTLPGLGDSRRKVWRRDCLDDVVDFHRFAPLNTRDLLTPYPGKGLYRLRR